MARIRDHRAERQRANERARAAGYSSKDARLRAARKASGKPYVREGKEYRSYSSYRWSAVLKPARTEAHRFGEVYQAWLGNRNDTANAANKFLRIWGQGSTKAKIGPTARTEDLDEVELEDGWFNIREWGERYDELYAEHAAA